MPKPIPAYRALLGLLVACTLVPAAALDASLAQAAQTARSGCADATTAELTRFFDGTIPRRLEQDRVPGAVVSVVSGGATVFAGGYGMADVELGVPFSESRSLVRIASISKLFTWTAVMQQVEAGRLDLHTDVNEYLADFQIPSTYPEPVTLQDLMDHTEGFEDAFIGSGARTAAGMPSLGEYLADHIPARILPPGEISAYTNYGAALAGYVVAEVSGEPYDVYVRRRLLEPLGMTRTTAAQPVPAGLAADLARSYDSDTDPLQAMPFDFTPMPPEGGISATAVDMARFMAAHLNQGRSGANQILSPATTAQMHEQSFTADPHLPGYAHGFKELTINGHRVLMHDGGWEGFRSGLLLVPDCDLGLFLAANATGGATTLTEVIEPFFDRFAPEAAVSAAAGSSPRTAPAAVTGPTAGFYHPTRHNESTIEKLTTLVGATRLTVAADGTVRFQGMAWEPQPDGRYRAADGTGALVFLAGPGGRRYAATDTSSYRLVPRSDTLLFNLWLLLGFAVPALSALALPVAGVRRRLTHRPAATSATWRAARWLAAGSAFLGVAFLVRLMAVLSGDTSDFLYGAPLSLQLLLGIPVVSLVAAAGALACTAKGWSGSGAGRVARAHQVALLAGLIPLAWFLWHWHLIGWQFA